MKIIWRRTGPGTWIASVNGYHAHVATEYGNPECRAEVRRPGENPHVTYWSTIEDARAWCERELVWLCGGEAPQEQPRNGRGVTGVH